MFSNRFKLCRRNLFITRVNVIIIRRRNEGIANITVNYSEYYFVKELALKLLLFIPSVLTNINGDVCSLFVYARVSENKCMLQVY